MRIRSNHLVIKRWILRFLEKPSWLEHGLPPNTFAFKSDIEGDEIKWIQWDNTMPPEKANVPGTSPGSVFTPVANPYGHAKENFDTMVHCTLRAWDHFVAPHLARLGVLARRKMGKGNGPPLSDKDLNEMDEIQDMCTEYAFHALVKIALRRTMSSRIPFHDDKPIIRVPPMKVVTLRIGWVEPGNDQLECRRLYRRLLDEPYGDLVSEALKDPKTRNQKQQERKKPSHPIAHRSRFISILGLSPFAAAVSFAQHQILPTNSDAKEAKTKGGKTGKGARHGKDLGDPFGSFAPLLMRFRTECLWKLPNGRKDHGKPDLDRLREMVLFFRKICQNTAEGVIPESGKIRFMSEKDLERGNNK